MEHSPSQSVDIAVRRQEDCLNQDFHKIFKIDKIFSNPAHLENLMKILVQDNPGAEYRTLPPARPDKCC